MTSDPGRPAVDTPDAPDAPATGEPSRPQTAEPSTAPPTAEPPETNGHHGHPATTATAKPHHEHPATTVTAKPHHEHPATTAPEKPQAGAGHVPVKHHKNKHDKNKDAKTKNDKDKKGNKGSTGGGWQQSRPQRPGVEPLVIGHPSFGFVTLHSGGGVDLYSPYGWMVVRPPTFRY
ncbi:hypothetical protein [Actinoplanes rectilineatus]|uniref:hypothetical protein n=1 Tax=Actinoplanes rectilineatus TaxID=113571 RepID=UPI0005F2F7C0|nr:hypothetical protein [Actinoplanes rectilineatus]